MEVANELSKKDRFLEPLRGKEHTSASNAHIASVFERANKALDKAEFPTTRVEDWKYTRVGKIANREWNLRKSESAVDGLSYNIPRLDCHQLVFVNGYFREDLSSTVDDDLVALPMSKAHAAYKKEFEEIFGSMAEDESSIFTAINTTYATDGAFVLVKNGKQASKPVHLVYLNDTDGVIAQPRNAFVVQKSATLDVIMSISNDAGQTSFTNMVSEIYLSENARLTIDKIQKGTDDGFVNCLEKGIQHRDSHFRLNTHTLSGGWTRNTSEMKVAGSNCTTDLYGSYMPTGKSHVDNHTMIDHAQADCQSNELYKGIIHDSATGVFNGKVFVRQDAQRIDAFQQNSNIVMTENGKMNSKPELEIYADDVKCSHGSTTGQFDEDALFYLMTRGIGKETAKKLLVSAFVSDVMEKTTNEAVREYLLAQIESH